MAERRETQRIQYAREDIYRNYVHTIPRIVGVNQTLAPNLINDDEFQEIWNFLPTAKGSIKKIKAPLKLISTTKVPVKILIHPLQGVYQGLVFFNDGSVYRWNGSNLFQVAQANTLSGDPSYFDFCVWQNRFYYIVDKVKGYFKWDGVNFSQVSSDIKGDSIVIWQGRIFIGNGSTVSYSVALDPEDFVSEGSGYFDLAQSFPDLKLKVKKIIPYIDSLLIYGDSAIMALTGSTISNDPSAWYLTEANNTIGIENANATVNYGNEIWIQNEKGLFRTTISHQQKFDYKVDIKNAIKILNYQACITNINNLLFYLIPIKNYSPFRGLTQNILAFCIDTAEFFFLDLGKNVYGLYYSYIEGQEDRVYALCEDGIYALFEGGGAIEGYLKSKRFDFGKGSLEKNFLILMLPIWFEEGNTELKITVITEKGQKVVLHPFVGAETLGLQWMTDESYKIAFTDINENYVWGFIRGGINLINLVSFINVVGVWGEIVLQDKGDAVYNLTNIHIKTQLGRDVF